MSKLFPILSACTIFAEIFFIMIEDGIFKRTELLVGDEVMDRIASARVIVFGVGGVGSWCVESLVRSGISNITIVDSDCVCITNINRQLMATTKTVGQPKVEVLKQRLLEINPRANIDARREIYSEATADSFHLETYDYVIDAIDSLENKASLIRRACRSGARLYSSMGAALKMDPTKIAVAEFWNVRGCPLAAALRKKFKKSKLFPSKKFKCVYSEELLQNQGSCGTCGTAECFCRKAEGTTDENDWHAAKVHTNGTMAHITAIFGFTLAGLVMDELYRKSETL